MKVDAAIAEILKREGIEFLISYPLTPIIEAAAVADIRTIIVRQERTGLHMADAVSRMTSGKQVGVFAMQYGPGSENAFGGVAQAFGESVPLLVLPAGYPREETNVAPNFSSLVNFKHVTRLCEQVTVPAATPDAMRRAFARLRNGPGGPVLVEFPWDVLSEEIGGRLEYQSPPSSRSAPDPAAVDEAAELLVAAERPVLYAGQGVHYAQAWAPLRELAEHLGIPVTTSLQGKSAFPEDHRLSLGSGGRSMPAAVHRQLADADLVFGIGCSFTKTLYGIPLPTGSRVVHATLDPSHIGKDLAPELALAGDAGLTLQALLEAVRERVAEPRLDRLTTVAEDIARINEEWLAAWMPKLASEATPLSPYRVIWDLLHTVDKANTVITHDAGSPRDQLSPFWRSTEPLSYLGWGKTTQLGYGLGLAMGAKLAVPEKLCINVWGDAAIGFTGMDFETAVRERIPILSILLNNFSMAIELPVMEVATEKFRSTDISGHYADFARALGGYGERVTEPGEIIPAIKRGIEQTENGTPALLEFITEKEIETSSF